jgi:hypothetical protein
MHPTQSGRAHKLHQSRITTYSLHHSTSKIIIYATIEHSLILLSHVTQRLHAQHITSPTQIPTSHKCQSPPSTSPPHRRRPANTYGAPNLTQNEAARHGAARLTQRGSTAMQGWCPFRFFSNRHHDPLNLHGCDRTIFSQGAKSILAWFAIGRVGVGGGVYRSGDG